MTLPDILYLAIALMVCIPVHEASHALAAYWLGDPTAKVEGRISLNPMKHLDLFGTLMILFAQFGWGKPTPFNPHNLSHPKRDSALIALAGPISNLLTAILAAALLQYLPMSNLTPLEQALGWIYQLSVVLFLFNLLPIAPLDGSKFLGLFVPHRFSVEYNNFLSKGPVYLIGLVIIDRLIAVIFNFSFLGLVIGWGFEKVAIVIEILIRS